MKRANSILVIILLMMTGCGEGSKQTTNDFITVDVTHSYSTKELILQDFMDVEYVALETADEFLCQGLVLDIGKEIMIVRNQINDGDIFHFDRKGKGLRKINRRGQGPEEYMSIMGITLDEDNGEMFVRDFGKGIMVYDLNGKFLRRLSLREDFSYMLFKNYDSDHLICGDSHVPVDEKSTESHPCVIISKQDGSIVNDIRIHIKQGVNTRVNVSVAGFIPLLSGFVKSFIHYHDDWIITELSSDTIFRLLPDLNMIPFMARTPSVHSMNPEIFLHPVILTKRYYFMETIKKEYDSSIPESYPRKKLIYDRQEKTIHQYTVCNNDYTTPKAVDFSLRTAYSMNKEITFWQKLEAYELVEAYEKGQLKGQLKEVAAKLDADSNPVIMLVKYKKLLIHFGQVDFSTISLLTTGPISIAC